jgi:SAM-dependent methyltransferase
MEWFADEEFWRELYPYMFPPERFAAAAEQVAQIVALTGFAGSTVLDLCCGPGRHAVEFARLGFQVTGVDRTRFLLERARERGAGAGVEVEWVESDMRDFLRPAAFDLACSLFTSFGYFEREEDELRVLRNVSKSLRDGAPFVVDVTSKEKVARFWQNSFYREFADGAVLIERPRVCADWCRMENEWTLLTPDGRFRKFGFKHWIYSGRELRDRLLASGFRKVRLFGDLAGAAYGLDSPRLIAVARK